VGKTHREEATNEKRLSEGKGLSKGEGIYIGIDFHKEKWHVMARVEGDEVFHGSMILIRLVSGMLA
jgi:hypothetical protein